jgi:hypothetical protein
MVVDEVTPENTRDTQTRSDVEPNPTNEVPDLYEEDDHSLPRHAFPSRVSKPRERLIRGE